MCRQDIFSQWPFPVKFYDNAARPQGRVISAAQSWENATQQKWSDQKSKGYLCAVSLLGHIYSLTFNT